MALSKHKTDDSFSALFDELEHIVQSFEGKTPNIDESLQLFERGLLVAEQLKKKLFKVENRIEELKAKYHLDAEASDENL